MMLGFLLARAGMTLSCWKACGFSPGFCAATRFIHRRSCWCTSWRVRFWARRVQITEPFLAERRLQELGTSGNPKNWLPCSGCCNALIEDFMARVTLHSPNLAHACVPTGVLEGAVVSTEECPWQDSWRQQRSEISPPDRGKWSEWAASPSLFSIRREPLCNWRHLHLPGWPAVGRQGHGSQVTCPWHGATFDVVTGEVLGPPAQVGVYRYNVRVVGDDIEIEI